MCFICVLYDVFYMCLLKQLYDVFYTCFIWCVLYVFTQKSVWCVLYVFCMLSRYDATNTLCMWHVLKHTPASYLVIRCCMRKTYMMRDMYKIFIKSWIHMMRRTPYICDMSLNTHLFHISWYVVACVKYIWCVTYIRYIWCVEYIWCDERLLHVTCP